MAVKSELINGVYYGKCPVCGTWISGTALCMGACHDCRCRTCGRGPETCVCAAFRPWSQIPKLDPDSYNDRLERQHHATLDIIEEERNQDPTIAA